MISFFCKSIVYCADMNFLDKDYILRMCSVLVVAILSLVANNSYAAVVTISFGGEISSVSGRLNSQSAFNLGDSFAATVTYDTNYASANVGDDRTIYSFPSVTSSQLYYSMGIEVGGFSFSARNGIVDINDTPSYKDWYFLRSTATYGGLLGDVVAESELDFIAINLEDSDASVFSDESLPVGLPPLSEFESAISYMHFHDNGNLIGVVEVTITDMQVTTVPVPAGAWLFGSALIGLTIIKRKK